MQSSSDEKNIFSPNFHVQIGCKIKTVIVFCLKEIISPKLAVVLRKITLIKMCSVYSLFPTRDWVLFTLCLKECHHLIFRLLTHFNWNHRFFLFTDILMFYSTWRLLELSKSGTTKIARL